MNLIMRKHWLKGQSNSKYGFYCLKIDKKLQGSDSLFCFPFYLKNESKMPGVAGFFPMISVGEL